jgi:hypothetical protein
MRTTCVALAILLIAGNAAAEDRKPAWSASVRAGNVWMGPGERPTGGALVGLEGGRSWPIGDTWTIDALLGVDGHGFAGGSHWMGLWAGPAVGASRRTPADWLTIGAVARAQYGRATTCTDWGYCLRFWGLYPELDLRAGIGSDALQAVVDASVIYVDTLAWSGPAWQFRAGARFSLF